MRVLVQFGLCCLVAQGLWAAPKGSAAPARGGGYGHAPVRTHNFARRGGYGYGTLLFDDYDYGYGYGYGQSAPTSTVIYPPAPVVIQPSAMVSQTAHPVMYEVHPEADSKTLPEVGTEPILYLVAFRDGTIRAAMTYWTDKGILHYLDTNHKEKQAPLASVDRDLSAQLNRERRVPFGLQ